jgi:hypothetical protein
MLKKKPFTAQALRVARRNAEKIFGGSLRELRASAVKAFLQSSLLDFGNNRGFGI